jgi:hypothetical protein
MYAHAGIVAVLPANVLVSKRAKISVVLSLGERKRVS